jgi:paraquat-inducible protein A
MPLPIIECLTCGERYETLDPEQDSVRTYCSRCDQKLEERNKGLIWQALFLSIACLVLLVPANLYPILRFSFQGQWSETRIITSALLLLHDNSPVVAFAIFFTAVIAPFALHGMITTACIGLLTGSFPRFTRSLWRILFEFAEWGMIDVYLIALGVGAIKLLSMGSIEPKPGLWVVLLFVLVSGLCMASLNSSAVWSEIRSRQAQRKDSTLSGPTCFHCGSVQDESGEPDCAVCEAPLHARSMDKSKVWCYLIAAACLYLPANLLPVMNMKILDVHADYTIMGGILFLWEEHDYVPAIIVFLGSIVVPIVKMVAIFLLLFSHQIKRNQKQQTTLYLWVKTLGRWSMVDIFVLGVLVALGQMGVVATIEPKAGGIAFCGVVICTMFAANGYQPWWIWSKAESEKEIEYAHGTRNAHGNT